MSTQTLPADAKILVLGLTPPEDVAELFAPFVNRTVYRQITDIRSKHDIPQGVRAVIFGRPEHHTRRAIVERARANKQIAPQNVIGDLTLNGLLAALERLTVGLDLGVDPYPNGNGNGHGDQLLPTQADESPVPVPAISEPSGPTPVLTRPTDQSYRRERQDEETRACTFLRQQYKGSFPVESCSRSAESWLPTVQASGFPTMSYGKLTQLISRINREPAAPAAESKPAAPVAVTQRQSSPAPPAPASAPPALPGPPTKAQTPQPPSALTQQGRKRLSPGLMDDFILRHDTDPAVSGANLTRKLLPLAPDEGILTNFGSLQAAISKSRKLRREAASTQPAPAPLEPVVEHPAAATPVEETPSADDPLVRLTALLEQQNRERTVMTKRHVCEQCEVISQIRDLLDKK